MGFVQKAVSRLDEPEKLSPLVQELGCKHFHYSVNPIYVDVSEIIKAMLKTQMEFILLILFEIFIICILFMDTNNPLLYDFLAAKDTALLITVIW